MSNLMVRIAMVQVVVKVVMLIMTQAEPKVNNKVLEKQPQKLRL